MGFNQLTQYQPKWQQKNNLGGKSELKCWEAVEEAGGMHCWHEDVNSSAVSQTQPHQSHNSLQYMSHVTGTALNTAVSLRSSHAVRRGIHRFSSWAVVDCKQHGQRHRQQNTSDLTVDTQVLHWQLFHHLHQQQPSPTSTSIAKFLVHLVT